MIALSEGMVGKKLKIVCKSKKTFEGECVSYIPAKDNTPEIDSVWIKKTENTADEIYINEMLSLEVCKN